MTNSKKTGLWETPNANEDRAENYTKETSHKHWKEGRQVHLSQQVRDERLQSKPMAENKHPQLKLFAEASHANHSVKPGSEKARKMTVTSGQNISGLYKKSDPMGLDQVLSD